MTPSRRNDNPDTYDPGPKPVSRDARAPRYAIESPMHYRAAGLPGWEEGITINISRSGVLFRTAEAIEPRTMLEMHIAFPSEITGDSPARVICWGPVVRSHSILSGFAQAASIVKYRFTRD